MPEMSFVERAFCQSRPWRTFTRRVVLPWVLQGVRLEGHGLEIGGGSGAMASGILSGFPDVTLTLTDFDPKMILKAKELLERFGERVDVEQADATALPYPDSEFDFALSFIMLHHVIDWEKAIAEMCRVIKPGGTLIAYDLLNTLPMRRLHQAEGASFRMMRFEELLAQLRTFPLEGVALRKGLAGLVVRFRGTRAGS